MIFNPIKQIFSNFKVRLPLWQENVEIGHIYYCKMVVALMLHSKNDYSEKPTLEVRKAFMLCENRLIIVETVTWYDSQPIPIL